MKRIVMAVLGLFTAAACFPQAVRDHRSNMAGATPAAVAPELYEVILYENPNFDGRFQAVKPASSGNGSYTLDQFNDMASSIQVPRGMVAVLYEHANENGGYGACITLMEDCPDLSVYNLNDRVSHIVVFPASKPGYHYVRPKKINGQVIAGQWRRAAANGRLPDNSPPAVLQYTEATITPSKPVVDESLPVFRIQIRLVTGSGKNEDTDKEVYVKLNTIDPEYFLDYGPDDFETGADKKYDIISYSIRKVSDIQFIEVGARGDDVWGIKKIELYINNSASPVFSKTFSTATRINGAGNWQRKVYFSNDELRNNIYWQTIATDANIKKPPVPIPAEMIKSMVESMVGNILHYKGGGKLFWGNKNGLNTVWGEHVEMKRKDGNTLNFNLDLEAEITTINPAIDVDFDLVFECTGNGIILIKTDNVKTSCDFPTPLIQPSCETVRSIINGILGWVGLTQFVKIDDYRTGANTFNASFAIGTGGFKCKGVQVTPKGDIIIY